MLHEEASRMLHEEASAGCKGSLGLKISQEVEIRTWCAFTVSYLPSPVIAPVPPGPGRMLGTCWVGHWWRKQLGRGMVVLACLERRECIFFPCCSGRLGKERIVPHSVVGPLAFLVFLLMFVWGATAIGPRTGERCWPLLAGLWRAIAPLMKPWRAEEDVPTAANLNLYREMEIAGGVAQG